jgi:anaerobic ribonucleoside-triphosphate reductase activating protein
MRYADITTCDIANGKGLGVVLWCQGCSLNCPGCQNKCTHAAAEGKEFTFKEADLIMEELKRSQISRLTLSGGHPLEPYNIQECTELCKRVRCEVPDTEIWCYTGWLWEDVKDFELIKYYVDVLVDGPYVEHLRDISLPWRGSSNQRVIDVKASLLNKTVTLLDHE